MELTGKDLVGKRIKVIKTGTTPTIGRFITAANLYVVEHDDGGMGWLNREQFEVLDEQGEL